MGTKSCEPKTRTNPSYQRPGHPLPGFFRYLDQDKNGKLTRVEWKKMMTFLDRYQHENALMAIRPGDQQSKTEIVWKHRRGVPECPSPLFYDGNVYTIKNGGIISCLDAKTGKLKYQKRLKAGGPYYASPVVSNGKIYMASARGVVTVIEAGDTLQVLAENDLAKRIMATPALVEGIIYVRTDTSLIAFQSQ